MWASIQTWRLNCLGRNSSKYFLDLQAVEMKTLKACELSTAVNVGVVQSATVAFIFFSSVFCKKWISHYFVFQLKEAVCKGLKCWLLNGTVSVGRFVMVCMYMHTVLAIAKCELQRLAELYKTTRLCSYCLKQQLICSVFVWPYINVFVVALNITLISQDQGREKG